SITHGTILRWNALSSTRWPKTRFFDTIFAPSAILLPSSSGEADPPWLFARNEPIASAIATPAATNKNKHRTARNPDDVDVRFEAVISSAVVRDCHIPTSVFTKNRTGLSIFFGDGWGAHASRVPVFAPRRNGYTAPGRGGGVGRGLGVACGRAAGVGLTVAVGVAVAVAVTVAVAVGVPVTVAVGVGETVTVGVAVAVAVGVGVIGGVGVGLHGIPWHRLMVTVSTRQPSAELMLSLAIRQRSLHCV